MNLLKQPFPAPTFPFSSAQPSHHPVGGHQHPLGYKVNVASPASVPSKLPARLPPKAMFPLFPASDSVHLDNIAQEDPRPH